MSLDETISAGQTGHINDHQFVHGLMNSELVVYVQHGGTAGTARPDVAGSAAAVALWDGSVAPSNGVAGDFWWDTTNDLSKRYDGTVWTASGSGASGVLLGSTHFQATEGSATDVSTTNTSLTELFADGSLDVTFTVPASGSVLVRLTGHTMTTADHQWGLLEGGTAVSEALSRFRPGVAFQSITVAFVVDGLTPGASKTWRWAQSSPFGSTVTTRVGGGNAPAVIEVWSA